MTTPTEIANQALDAMGSNHELGDLSDGSREARVLERAYGQCLRQILRTAHWDFARKQAPLDLLADATSPNADVLPNLVPGPFRFSYAYPIDCTKARSVPWASSLLPPSPGTNITAPTAPLMPGVVSEPGFRRRIPSARFLVAVDVNEPPLQGQQTDRVQGVSPQGRTVILTDVPNASLIYTALMLYPENWDPLFRDAFVSHLASQTVLAIMTDKKLGLTIRGQQIAITKEKISAARVADGNEGTTTTDHVPDFISGRYGPVGSTHETVFGERWDTCTFSDGSSF